MTGDNPYAPPRTEVADTADAARKPSAGARFAWSFGCALPVFLSLILIVPKDKRGVAALGATIFAAASGLIGMCIPARRKVWFILPGIIIIFVLAALLGRR